MQAIIRVAAVVFVTPLVIIALWRRADHLILVRRKGKGTSRQTTASVPTREDAITLIADTPSSARAASDNSEHQPTSPAAAHRQAHRNQEGVVRQGRPAAQVSPILNRDRDLPRRPPSMPLEPTRGSRASLVRAARAEAQARGPRESEGRPHTIAVVQAVDPERASRLYGSMASSGSPIASREGSFVSHGSSSGRYSALRRNAQQPPPPTSVGTEGGQSDDESSSFGRASPRSRRRWITRPAPSEHPSTWSTPSRGVDYTASGWSVLERAAGQTGGE